jgi:hypothetical protein
MASRRRPRRGDRPAVLGIRERGRPDVRPWEPMPVTPSVRRAQQRERARRAVDRRHPCEAGGTGRDLGGPKVGEHRDPLPGSPAVGRQGDLSPAGAAAAESLRESADDHPVLRVPERDPRRPKARVPLLGRHGGSRPGGRWGDGRAGTVRWSRRPAAVSTQQPECDPDGQGQRQDDDERRLGAAPSPSTSRFHGPASPKHVRRQDSRR